MATPLAEKGVAEASASPTSEPSPQKTEGARCRNGRQLLTLLYVSLDAAAALAVKYGLSYRKKGASTKETPQNEAGNTGLKDVDVASVLAAKYGLSYAPATRATTRLHSRTTRY
jgi:hypothetical protein